MEAAGPRDALEEILVGLWGTVLKQPAPGIHDNFFELGGHSLLATQLVSRLRDALGMTVPVRWLFEAPSVAELADRLRPALAASGTDGPPGGMVLLEAPDGTQRAVPAGVASQYITRGAKRVG